MSARLTQGVSSAQSLLAVSLGNEKAKLTALIIWLGTQYTKLTPAELLTMPDRLAPEIPSWQKLNSRSAKK